MSDLKLGRIERYFCPNCNRTETITLYDNFGAQGPFLCKKCNCKMYPEDKIAKIEHIRTNHKSFSGEEELINLPVFEVQENGIYKRTSLDSNIYECIIPKEVFIEAYNKYIKGEE